MKECGRTWGSNSGPLACQADIRSSYSARLFFIWILRPITIISLSLSRVNHKVGRKREIPEKKHLTTRKQNLACLMWPKLGLNPQRWEDEQFRVLKISALNHSNTGAAWKHSWQIIWYKVDHLAWGRENLLIWCQLLDVHILYLSSSLSHS